MSLKPLQFEDFSAGFTDDTFAGNPNEMHIIKNCFITSDNKLLMRSGSVLNDTARAFTPAGYGSRVGHLAYFDGTLLERVASQIFYNNSGYTQLTGPSGNSAFPTLTVNDGISIAPWNNHLFLAGGYLSPQKIYRNSVGTLVIRSAGLPEHNGTSVFTPDDPGSNHSYLYKFVYKYTYTAGGTDAVTFIDRGTPSSSTIRIQTNTPISTTAGRQVEISGLVYPSNGSTDNWDTANILIEVYRTIDNGTVFHLVDTVPAGSTTYTDQTDDTNLEANELLYTEGGVAANDIAPKAKYIHVLNDVCYYANLIQDSQKHKNRIRQSKQGDLDSVPLDFFDDIEDEITGISSYKSNPIVFGTRSVYRLDGVIDDLGRGAITHERISDVTGCVNHNSIVQTQLGVFFAGNDGFYYTDGYTVQKISDNINTTYSTLASTATKQSKIFGTWEAEQERVWWGVQLGSSGADNDSCLVLDTRKGIKKRSSFVAVDSSDFGPASILFVGQTLYRGHKNGWIFKHDGSKYTDPRIDITLDPALWGTETILYQIKDVCRNFGTNFVRKWVPRVQVCTKNDGNLAIQPAGYNDGKSEARLTKPIRFLSGFVWGDPNFVWGDQNCVWNDSRIIEEWRRMPAGGLRTEYFQFELTNAEVILQNSDDFGEATIDAAAGTVTLNDAAQAWLSESDGYLIAFENDDYTAQFQVYRRLSDTVLKLTGVTGLPASGGYKWQLSGKQKGQILHLINYVIFFRAATDSQTAYNGQTGANAT